MFHWVLNMPLVNVSLLFRDGLEVIMHMKVEWDNGKCLEISKDKAHDVAKEYVDDSRNILIKLLSNFGTGSWAMRLNQKKMKNLAK